MCRELFLLVFLCLASASIYHSSAADVVLRPTKTAGQQVAMIIIPAAQVKPAQYTPLASALQTASNFSLWIGIPELDNGNKDYIGGAIDHVLASMKSQGMLNSSKSFLSAHSSLSSGPALQDYLSSNKTLAQITSGQILMGAFLQRKYRNTVYPVPTLTISGELDGVCRVTRVMEEYFHCVRQASDTKAALMNSPVVVLPGMSHSQFVAGDVPSDIRDNDLQPEVTESDAHKSISAAIAHFIAVRLGDSTSIPSLSKAVNATGVFLEPLIEAYLLEGSYQFKKPCYDDKPNPSCQVGSNWTEIAMVTMAEQKLIRLDDIDGFHPAAEIFPKIHHPQIFNNCSTPDTNCIIKLSSVSENIYEKDKEDTGHVPTSAKEIRAKLKSRQSVMLAGGYKNVDFNTSDAGSRCKTINQQAYDWALSRTNPKTQSRFKQYGVPLVMGEDKGCLENGGLWIYLPMEYRDSTDSSGKKTLELLSIQLKTPVTYKIGLFAGMHYCKLLSPARAMEWIYVDGLRSYYSM